MKKTRIVLKLIVMKSVRLILDHLKGQKIRLICVFFFVILSSIISLLSSLIFGYTIDSVIDDGETTNSILILFEKLLGGKEYIRENLYILAIALVVVALLSALFMFLRYYHQTIVAERLNENLKNHLYTHIEHLPFSYHKKVQTGDLVQRCTSDVDRIRTFFSGQIEEIVATITSAVFALYVMFSLNVKLSYIVLLTLPIIFFICFYFFNRIQKQFVDSDEKEAAMTVDIGEALNGVRVIKAFNREKYELNKFLKLSDEYKDVTSKMIVSLGYNWGFSYMVNMFGILTIILIGIKLVSNGEISTGNFLVFISYETTILNQIRNLSRILSDFGKVVVSCRRISEILDEKAEDLESGSTPDLNGDIIFNDVCFKYDDDDKYILKDINLDIKKGETVAIIGPTGSGKSSLIHLLDRLYDVTSGSITINGYDVNDIAKGYLRKNVGVVLQESFLFSKTIYENIKTSNESIDSKAIEKACMIASVDDVIKSFDKGYKTIVGEKGVTLSGGQKQRIAIARAIVNNTPIIIFDDSLSAVDTKTDAKIRKSLKDLSSASTIIIITQRVASAKDADKIVVIEDGKISAVGKHEDLIKEDGLYKRINDIQSQKMVEGLNV